MRKRMTMKARKVSKAPLSAIFNKDAPRPRAFASRIRPLGGHRSSRLAMEAALGALAPALGGHKGPRAVTAELIGNAAAEVGERGDHGGGGEIDIRMATRGDRGGGALNVGTGQQPVGRRLDIAGGVEDLRRCAHGLEV